MEVNVPVFTFTFLILTAINLIAIPLYSTIGTILGVFSIKSLSIFASKHISDEDVSRVYAQVVTYALFVIVEIALCKMFFTSLYTAING